MKGKMKRCKATPKTNPRHVGHSWESKLQSSDHVFQQVPNVGAESHVQEQGTVSTSRRVWWLRKYVDHALLATVELFGHRLGNETRQGSTHLRLLTLL